MTVVLLVHRVLVAGVLVFSLIGVLVYPTPEISTENIPAKPPRVFL